MGPPEAVTHRWRVLVWTAKLAWSLTKSHARFLTVRESSLQEYLRMDNF